MMGLRMGDDHGFDKIRDVADADRICCDDVGGRERRFRFRRTGSTRVEKRRRPTSSNAIIDIVFARRWNERRAGGPQPESAKGPTCKGTLAIRVFEPFRLEMDDRRTIGEKETINIVIFDHAHPHNDQRETDRLLIIHRLVASPALFHVPEAYNHFSPQESKPP
ncbi:hypothetical protein BD410DRAFT_806085 [Rickenella mellea]|uniref:Uncharacterized protein n=1 Tax=Rickenella mellea TaxID=50990 RepID=A0A4Y7PU84_9AGAM|nr:hypothetical protein BD410DRAFT_806085 [Rickenella mellea]